MPLFLAGSSNEPMFPPPKPTPLDKTLEWSSSINNVELAKIWGTLSSFCDLINEAAVDRRKVSEEVVLETMASVMYRLLHMSVTSGSPDEIIRFATLSFCANAFLPWRQLRMPCGWLQHEYKHSLTRFMPFHLACLGPRMRLWLLITYGISFFPLSANELKDVQAGLMQATEICGVTSLNSVIETMGSFLWINIVCNRPAEKLFDETVA